MHFALKILLLAQIGIFNCRSDWVKISQSSSEDRNITDSGDDGEPSPAWIQYQKERFSGMNVSQRLTVSGENHLKTSAEIVVPAKLNDSKRNRNKIVRAKTKLTIEDIGSNEAEYHSTKPTHPDPKNPPKSTPSENITFNGDLKLPSFVGFLNFLTSLQQSLIRKTSFGIIDKIKLLKNIRDQLMWNIEDRFSVMFPKSRQRRGLTDESSFQFPSEAALMSISFLTFSVFLIKLVLQVIHIIKSKHYTYSGMGMNNMTTTRYRRNARTFDGIHEELETMRMVSAAIGVNPFVVK